MISNRLVWICTFYLHVSILRSTFGVKLFHMLQTGAKKACGMSDPSTDTTLDQSCKAITYPCCLCGASSDSFRLLPTDEVAKNIDNEVCFAVLRSLIALFTKFINKYNKVSNFSSGTIYRNVRLLLYFSKLGMEHLLLQKHFRLRTLQSGLLI
jgi:hypothetical protein